MTPPPVGLGPLGGRTPVLVGVGTATGIGDAGVEAAELMARATEEAGRDTGSDRVLASVDRIAVPQGTWGYPDPGRLVAARIGAPAARTHLVELGIPQQSLINRALTAVASGAAEVVVVTGGEAMLRSRLAARRGETATETAQPGGVPDEVVRRSGTLVEPVEQATRLWEPVQQYAMIGNALRAAEGSSVDDQRAEVADLWARGNLVAASNPGAAFPSPRTAAGIDTPSPDNRPLAFPYNKWHATQWTVDQAAALLLCSVDAARRLGTDPDRWLFPLVGLESSHSLSILCRREIHRWPAMGVLGRAAAARVGRPVDGIEVAEVYSCFPSAVQVQQRELGLPIGGTPTVTGWMAFAGGPFNNFVYQATAAVARRLRQDPTSLGMVTTVSGLLTKPGLAVWSATPDEADPLVGDLADEAAAETATVPAIATLEEYSGEATVATYTVTYEQLEPVRTVVVADTPDGRRSVAFSEDRALAAEAVGTELIGRPVVIADGAFRPA